MDLVKRVQEYFSGKESKDMLREHDNFISEYYTTSSQEIEEKREYFTKVKQSYRTYGVTVPNICSGIGGLSLLLAQPNWTSLVLIGIGESARFLSKRKLNYHLVKSYAEIFALHISNDKHQEIFHRLN